MAGGIAFHETKRCWSEITVSELREALDDPRIKDTFLVSPAANYPGLAISTGGEENWYLGYIDLFDGSVTINPERGMRDGKNPFHEDEILTYADGREPFNMLTKG